MTPARAAAWLVWGAYGLMAVVIAATALVVRSPQSDIGAVMGSMLGLGGAGIIVAAALFAGSAMGTYGLMSSAETRRIGIGLTVILGWAGFVVLAWLLWGFWMS